MYQVRKTLTPLTFLVEKECDKCGKQVEFFHKFCQECGSKLEAPTEGVEAHICIDDELHEVGKACIASLAKECGACFAYGATVNVEVSMCKNAVVSANRWHFCCEKCGTSIGSRDSFCTECGNRLDVPEKLTTELTQSEVEALVLVKFYEKNPTLRPKQEHKFNVDCALYQKLIGSSDFEDVPLTGFEMINSADEVNADIATELLLEDFDKDGAYYATLKDPLKETIATVLKKWDKCSEFHEEDKFVALCSLGDEHEFLIDICITEID